MNKFVPFGALQCAVSNIISANVYIQRWLSWKERVQWSKIFRALSILTFVSISFRVFSGGSQLKLRLFFFIFRFKLHFEILVLHYHRFLLLYIRTTHINWFWTRCSLLFIGSSCSVHLIELFTIFNLQPIAFDRATDPAQVVISTNKCLIIYWNLVVDRD